MTEKQTRVNKYKVEPKTKEPKEQIEDKVKKEHPLLRKIFLIIFLITLSIVLYSSFVGTKIIEVKEYKIESPKLPETFHGLKIVQFSDIHYGTTINQNQLDKIVTKINNLKPDVIIFTGDLIDKNITLTKEIEKEITDSLNKLNCTLYKYAIYGDEDLENKNYQDIMTNTNFQLLSDSKTLLYYKNQIPIEITGYNPIKKKPNYTIITNQIDGLDTTNYYKLVLVHEPDSIDKITTYKPDLVLSGHSLGGLVDLHFTKTLFLPENATKYYEDYQKVKETDLYISNGLGTSELNARLNNHPSITLYRFYKTK